jgi:hypothetical protein
MFYFVTALLDGKTTGWRAWLCIPAAGFGWGMLMNSDVQRGLYFSVAIVAYALFLLFRDARKPADFMAMPRLAGLFRMILVGVFTLLLFAHNAQLQFGSELVSGKVTGVQEESPASDEERWAFATSWSFHPKELIDSLAPGYHGMLSGDPDRPYWGSRPVAHSNDGLGYFVLFFAVAGALAGFRTSPFVRFFAVMTVLATLLAFGEFWPGRPLFSLWYHLPMMDKMRAPVKFMSVAAFGLSVLSAFGFRGLLDALKENRQGDLKRWRLAFGLVAGMAGFGLISAMAGEGSFPAKIAQSGAVKALAWMAFFSIAGLILMVMGLRKKTDQRLPAIIGGAFVFLLVFNLFQINRFYITRSWFEPARFYQADEAIQFLQQNAQQSRVACSFKMIFQGRMVPLSILSTRDFYVTHLFQYFGIDAMEHTPQSRISGDHDNYFKALLPEAPASGSALRFASTLLDGQIRFWRQSGVRYILTDGNLYGISPQPVPVFDLMRQHPALTLVFNGKAMGGQPAAIFELKDSVPVLAIIPSAITVAERDDALQQIKSGGFNPLATTVIAETGISTGGAGSVKVLEKKPGIIRLSIETDAPSVLRWLSRYDAGWKAEINGTAAELFPADYIMTGLQVPAGRHEVYIRYDAGRGIIRETSFWLSILSGLCLIIALFFEYFRTQSNSLGASDMA